MLLDLLQKRFSCRNFAQKPIPDDVVHYILECGRLSASGGNEQPWKFGVITDAETIRKITDAAAVNFKQSWIAKSPLLIVLCTPIIHEINNICRNRFPSLKEKIDSMDRGVYAAVHMEEHQTKIPGEHMVLAALEHGVYSTWISSVNCELVGELIGAQGYLVSNVLAFGYPEKMRNPTKKKDLQSITFTNHFSNAGV